MHTAKERIGNKRHPDDMDVANDALGWVPRCKEWHKRTPSKQYGTHCERHKATDKRCYGNPF